MPTKKSNHKIFKRRVCAIAKTTACASFLILAIIAVSSLVRAMSLEEINNEEGIPSSWEIASLGNPETIVVPITYWDQRQDVDCWTDGKYHDNNSVRKLSYEEYDKIAVPNRQFEWSMCQVYGPGVQQGLVKNTLGSDGLPIPAFTTVAESRAAGVDYTSEYVLGHDPVIATDNFYRWFHNTSVSQSVERKLTFYRTGNNTYKYGGDGIFPLDNFDYSINDPASSEVIDGTNHNFHFTAHLRIPIKVDADGQEVFNFTGDDDVWVFLNNQLVLDIGGVHSAIHGWFRINKDATITSYVEDNNLSIKQKTFSIGVNPGDVVNLDFFYAERSTTASNTEITIANMNWPISADSHITSRIVGHLEEQNTNIIEYTADIENRDTNNPLTLERVAAYIDDQGTSFDENGQAVSVSNSGFLPLDSTTLSYTTTPEDDDSWTSVAISAPQNNVDGFNLKNPITLSPNGETGDQVYFRFYSETSSQSGTSSAKVSFYTSLGGETGITYDSTPINYEAPKYNLTVNYVYANGEEAHTSYTSSLFDQESYEVFSPEIDGYDANIASVSGIMDTNGATYTVVYTPKTYPLTIYYQYENGEEAHAAYESNLTADSAYSIISPIIDGYTADQLTVTGTMSNSAKEIIVKYAEIPYIPPETHLVRIEYIYENGDSASESYEFEVEIDQAYDVPSPIIDGYTPDQEHVEGIGGTEDISITVIYSKDQDPVAPTEPSEPSDEPIVTPSTQTPSAPSGSVTDTKVPIISIDNVLDDGLILLNPLGEVAYIPSAGVISSVISPLFEQYFADIILSQGFVLAVLLIFSASFAIYFSLRRYLNQKPKSAEINKKVKKNSKKQLTKNPKKKTKK